MKTLTLTRGIASTGHTLYITDATQTYDTDLPARSALALLPYITYQKTGEDLQVLEPAAYSPLDVVTFSVDVEDRDGIYYAVVFAVDLYEGGELEEGSIVYDISDSTLKKMIDGVLTEITVASLLEEDVDYGEINSKIITELSQIRDRLTLIVADLQSKSIEHLCEEQEYQVAKFKRDYVNSMLYRAHIKFCTAEYAVAQQSIETGLDYGQKAIDEYSTEE